MQLHTRMGWKVGMLKRVGGDVTIGIVSNTMWHTNCSIPNVYVILKRRVEMIGESVTLLRTIDK